MGRNRSILRRDWQNDWGGDKEVENRAIRRMIRIVGEELIDKKKKNRKERNDNGDKAEMIEVERGFNE